MKSNNQSGQPHYEFRIQVRYPDYDTQLFVNHSKICTYVESAYISFFIDCLKADWNYSHIPILLKAAQTEYLRPITIKSNPLCILKVREVRTKGVRLGIEIVDEKDMATVYAIAERTLIHVDLNNARPIAFSTFLLNCLTNYIISTP